MLPRVTRHSADRNGEFFILCKVCAGAKALREIISPPHLGLLLCFSCLFDYRSKAIRTSVMEKLQLFVTVMHALEKSGTRKWVPLVAEHEFS